MWFGEHSSPFKDGDERGDRESTSAHRDPDAYIACAS
jgi:hypothetical protein